MTMHACRRQCFVLQLSKEGGNMPGDRQELWHKDVLLRAAKKLCRKDHEQVTNSILSKQDFDWAKTEQ